jgi:uncharacterized membrane protein
MGYARTAAGPLFPALDPRRALNRFVLAAMAGALVLLALAHFRWPVRLVAAYDALALVELALSLWIVASSDADETRRLGEGHDPARTLLASLVIGLSLVSLFVAIVLLRHARRLAPGQGAALATLCAIAIATSWLLTHTTYGAHYLRIYYRDGGGLQFPGEGPPVAWDFLYFSFTLAMCFQVSDVSVNRLPMRRAVLGHALISFLYNTAIIATALDLMMGLLE